MALTSLSSQSSIYSLVSNLMLLERQPVAKIESRKTDLQTLNGIYSDLKAKLSSLRSAAESMQDVIETPLSARAVSSSDSGVVTATASAGSDLGSHAVTVSQLAKHHTMVSNRLTSADTSLVTALGVGDYTFSITVDDVVTEVTVSLEADDTDGDVLSAVASAINVAMADVDESVSATALNDTSTTGKLVLRSESTGADHKMSLDDVTGTLLSALGIDNEAVASTDTTGGYIYSDSQLNAEFTIDGIAVSRSSNVVSDAISGVTFTLRSTQEADADPVTLSISADTASITDTVNDFLDKYNDTVTHIRNKTSVDRETGVRQALAGQFTYRNLLTEMRIGVAQSATTGAADIALLADIGITQDDDGLLSISDMDKFENALESNPGAVSQLFTADDGIATRIETMVEPFVKTGGYLDGDQNNTESRIDALDENIERWEARLKIREAQLIQQYSRLQEALASLNGFQNFLGSYLSSMGY
jgi:flagellar hook-associated protein 2